MAKYSDFQSNQNSEAAAAALAKNIIQTEQIACVRAVHYFKLTSRLDREDEGMSRI